MEASAGEVNWIATDTRVKDESDKNLLNTSRETVKDGQHDFDFELGSWDIHLKRLLHPLTGSTTWVQFDGGSFTQKVWNGRSQLEEFETDGALGHIEGLTLRLYNRQSQLLPPSVENDCSKWGVFVVASDQTNRIKNALPFKVSWPVVRASIGDAA